MRIEKVSREEWKKISFEAHLICFEENRPSIFERFDFTLIGIGENKELMGYVTCMELDSETIYLQHIGAFPGAKGNTFSDLVRSVGVDYCKDRYKRIFCYIKNTNLPAIKMAMSNGFFITGIKNFNRNIFLEHILEFDGASK